MQTTMPELKKIYKPQLTKACINKSFILKGPDELQNWEPAKTPNKFSLHTRGRVFFYNSDLDTWPHGGRISADDTQTKYQEYYDIENMTEYHGIDNNEMNINTCF
jgi:hypothetical protein